MPPRRILPVKLRVDSRDLVIARSASDEAIQSCLSKAGLLRFARNDGGNAQRYFAAITMISTLYCGAASLASTVARAGVLPADTQPSHAAFISGKVFMSVM
jgi:hypothetical protein